MTMYKIEIRNLQKAFMIWCAIYIAVLVLFMAFFPVMKSDTMQQLTQIKMDAMPEEIFQALGIGELASLTELSHYFAYVIQYMNLATAIYALSLGTSALIKEESRGTLEFLYAQPIQRDRIVAEKLAANFTIFSIYLAVSYAVSLLLFFFLKDEAQSFSKLFTDVSMIHLGIYFVGIFFLSMGFFLSTCIKTVHIATPIALALVFLAYMLGLISQMIESVSFLKYFSPLQFASPNVLISNDVEVLPFFIMGLLAILFLIMTFVIYRRKDFRI